MRRRGAPGGTQMSDHSGDDERSSAPDDDDGWRTDSEDEARGHRSEAGSSGGDPVLEEDVKDERTKVRQRARSKLPTRKGARRKRSSEEPDDKNSGGSESDTEAKTWDPTDPWQEPEPKYTRRDGFVNFVQARVGLARRRHAHKAAQADREDAAVLIQRVVRARAASTNGSSGSRVSAAPAAAAATNAAQRQSGDVLRLWQKFVKSERLKPARRWITKGRVFILGSAPLEANVDHFHRAILR